jgi:hypothetical protein
MARARARELIDTATDKRTCVATTKANSKTVLGGHAESETDRDYGQWVWSSDAASAMISA